jgi:hypothetical protein
VAAHFSSFMRMVVAVDFFPPPLHKPE